MAGNRVDAAARMLGASSDVEVVVYLGPLRRRLGDVVSEVLAVRSDLAGSVEIADDLLNVAAGHLSNAELAVAQVVQAAEEHLRGDG